MAGMKDVADAAGVSASTVSRVLNGKSYVNEETRQRVLAAVEKINFRPNALAKSLKVGRSNTICLMVAAIDNLMVPPIVRGAEAAARNSGFNVILCNTNEDESVEIDCIETMKTRLTDGFLFVSACGEEKGIHQLQAQGIPLVLVNRFLPEDVGKLDIISVDHYRGAYESVTYLIQAGYRRIALAHGRDDLYLYRERYRGYCDALRDAGIPYDESLVMREVAGRGDFFPLTEKLMELPNPPDAIFADSDPKALVVMRALHNLGVKIPEQVAVIGFDNVEMSSMTEPPLTTMEQPLYELGRVAANRLIRQILHKDECGEQLPPIQTILDCKLIVRQST